MSLMVVFLRTVCLSVSHKSILLISVLRSIHRVVVRKLEHDRESYATAAEYFADSSVQEL